MCYFRLLFIGYLKLLCRDPIQVPVPLAPCDATQRTLLDYNNGFKFLANIPQARLMFRAARYVGCH